MASGLGLKNREFDTGLKVLLSLACFVIVVTGLRYAAELFIPVMLGLFLAILSLPVLNWLNRKGLPRPLAIIMTVLINLMILFGIVFVATAATSEFQKEFQGKQATYALALKERFATATEMIDSRVEAIGGFFKGEEAESGSEENGELAGTQIPTLNEWFNQNWDSRLVFEWVGATDAVGRLTSLFSKSFFVLIISIFLLAESNRYAAKVKEVIRVRGPDLRRLQNSSQDIQKYLGIKTAVSFLTGLLAWFACLMLKVDFPILWGLVAFVFNYVPVIGSIVAAIPPMILALITGGFWPAAAVMGCYLAINIVIGNFLEPMLLGDRFGMSTVVVILSVLFWGFIWGPVGMFLAVPLTMVVKVMLDNSPDLRWISVMLSKSVDDSPRRRRRLRRQRQNEGNSEPPSDETPLDKPSPSQPAGEGAGTV